LHLILQTPLAAGAKESAFPSMMYQLLSYDMFRQLLVTQRQGSCLRTQRAQANKHLVQCSIAYEMDPKVYLDKCSMWCDNYDPCPDVRPSRGSRSKGGGIRMLDAVNRGSATSKLSRTRSKGFRLSAHRGSEQQKSNRAAWESLPDAHYLPSCLIGAVVVTRPSSIVSITFTFLWWLTGNRQLQILNIFKKIKIYPLCTFTRFGIFFSFLFKSGAENCP
jgi:hypothetical protein